MTKNRFANFLLLLCLAIAPAFADSNGKFPGKGSVEAYTRTVAIGNKANELQERGEFEAAVKLYKESIAIYPYDSAEFQNMGNALRKLGRHQESIDAQKKAIQLEPGYLSAWLGLGLSYKALNKLSDAEMCYRQALKIRPNSYDSNGLLGLVLQKQKRFSEARACFLKAKSLPEDKKYCQADKFLKKLDAEEQASH